MYAGDNYHCPACCRLGSAYGWAASGNTEGDWLRADLGETRLIMAILTQGVGPGSEYNEWVTRYKIAKSTNDNSWTTIRDSSENEVIFEGNSDRDSIVRNELPRSEMTRYVKITVVAKSEWPTLRWGIEGCPLSN